MNGKTMAFQLSIPRLIYWPVFAGIMMLAMRLYAPVGLYPTLAISQSTSNTVTITVISGNADGYALQMSTNLASSSWVYLRTNLTPVTPVVFDNIRITNSHAFLRMTIPH